MRVLQRDQFLPIPLDRAWDFFSSPFNLNAVTPAEMSFEITSEVPAGMYPGLIITYRIRPFLGVPFTWCTEITHIRERCYFIDEQRLGPYRMWHHEHRFREVENGVRMTDLLHYEIGKSFFGSLAGVLFVHRSISRIFDYRARALERLFGPAPMP